MTLPLTQRDFALLIALVQNVRLFSLRQVTDHWWSGETANARRRLRQLADADLVARVEVQARTLPELERPVIAWRPSADVPNFDAVSHQLQKRWQSLAVRPCSAFVATEHAARLFGGRNRGELKHPLQATHDLGVAQVWLELHKNATPWADAWKGEDLMAETRRGEKCPDAFIVNALEQVVCVIEFGGQYHAERVREFHEDCASRELPYQLW